MSENTSEPPQRSAMRRTARLLQLPLAAAGRGVRGVGARLGGEDAEAVSARLNAETAQQVFAVLGELKGGAMKVGQMWSMLEAALPEEMAAPYREQLRRLQAGAPPLPASRVHAVMAAELGPDWRGLFGQFNPRAAAAASIGQVHRATWAATGEPVAVKLQYPGADEALRSDLKVMERLSALISPLAGGFDVRAVARQAATQVAQECDYAREAAAQEQAARAYDGHPDVLVPHVVAHTGRLLVTQWVDGLPLTSAESAPDEERNRLGLAYARFLFGGPATSGLLHGDPHPGNFLVLADGRIAVLDWGLAQRLPDGLPPAMGRLLTIAAGGDAEAMVAGLRQEGFVTRDVEAAALQGYLAPLVAPAAEPDFHFHRTWLREQFERIGQDKLNDNVVHALNLPPSYLIIDRVWISGIAVLCQLDCRAPFRRILDEFLPGWEPPMR